MVASRKISTGSTGAPRKNSPPTGSTGALRKSSKKSDELTFGKKRSGAATSGPLAEPATAKRRRGPEKEESPISASSKMEESPEVSFDFGGLKAPRGADRHGSSKMEESPEVSFDFGGLSAPRGADRHGAKEKSAKDAFGKQLEELASSTKKLAADRRKAARDAVREESSKACSEENKLDALRHCDDTLAQEKGKTQQLFNKLQDAFAETQSSLEDYKAKVEAIRAQEEKDVAWLKQLEKNANEQLNEVLSDAFKSKGKK